MAAVVALVVVLASGTTLMGQEALGLLVRVTVGVIHNRQALVAVAVVKVPLEVQHLLTMVVMEVAVPLGKVKVLLLAVVAVAVKMVAGLAGLAAAVLVGLG